MRCLTCGEPWDPAEVAGPNFSDEDRATLAAGRCPCCPRQGPPILQVTPLAERQAKGLCLSCAGPLLADGSCSWQFCREAEGGSC